MTIEEAVNTHILTSAAIYALVGPRVYQGEREQGSALPAISFSIVAGESMESIDAGPEGLAFTTFQFNAYATTAKQAAAIRELLRLRFQTHRGAIMGGVGGVFVGGCLFSGLSEGFDPNDANRVYVRSIDFEIQHEQAVS